MTSDDERQLLRRIASGHDDAFREFYERYEKKLFSFIQRRLGDAFESADVFHEVMLEIWRGAERFEGRSRVSTWVFGVAHRKTVDALRRQGRHELVDTLDDFPDDDDVEQSLGAVGDARVVERCIAKLDPLKREAIGLIFSENMRYQEAAAAAGAAEGTIKARVHRAIKLIRACVSLALGEGGRG